eukprot:1318589-Pleurochrysis_carterae.AAC.3
MQWSACSCACCVASNEKEKPLQSVNMPLCDAVSIRRPSGVQQHALTDDRSLLYDVWRKRVHIDEQALSLYRIAVNAGGVGVRAALALKGGGMGNRQGRSRRARALQTHVFAKNRHIRSMTRIARGQQSFHMMQEARLQLWHLQ